MSGLQNVHFPTLFLYQNRKISIINYQLSIKIRIFAPAFDQEAASPDEVTLGKAGTRDRWQGPLNNQ